MDKLNEVLKDFVLPQPERQKKASPKGTWSFIDLIQNWEEIVGHRHRQNSLPLKLTDGCLVILMSHPIVAEQLKMTQLSLIRKIEKSYPSLKNQIVKLGFKTNETIFKGKLLEEQVNPTSLSSSYHRFSPEIIKLKEKAA